MAPCVSDLASFINLGLIPLAQITIVATMSNFLDVCSYVCLCMHICTIACIGGQRTDIGISSSYPIGSRNKTYVPRLVASAISH